MKARPASLMPDMVEVLKIMFPDQVYPVCTACCFWKMTPHNGVMCKHPESSCTSGLTAEQQMLSVSIDLKTFHWVSDED